MGISREMDKRYVVDMGMIQRAKSLRSSGMSYMKISRLMGLSYHTVYYWLNDGYRSHKRKINSKRRHPDNKKRQKDKVELYKRFTLDSAMGYVAKEVYSYQHLDRDVMILGVSMKKHWIPFLKKKYHKGGRKLGL